MKLYVIQAKHRRFWHGPYKDAGVCWGRAAEAWLFEDAKAARAALRGLSCASAAEAEVVEAPGAALVGGEPTEATDGELEVALDNVVKPAKRYRIIRDRESR